MFPAFNIFLLFALFNTARPTTRLSHAESTPISPWNNIELQCKAENPPYIEPKYLVGITGLSQPSHAESVESLEDPELSLLRQELNADARRSAGNEAEQPSQTEITPGDHLERQTPDPLLKLVASEFRFVPGRIESALHVDFTRVTPWDRFEKALKLHSPPNGEPVPDERESVNQTEPPATRKANAVIFMLTRNSDLKGVLSSMKQLEDRFNKKFQYPYVFLNDVPFEERFKSLVTQLTDVPVQFGTVPPDHWNQPPWVDENKASAARDEMTAKNILYAGSVSYRNMCRFNSGFFYRHELLKPYRYYWRFEPDVNFFCDIDYDPFLYMQDNNKVYGFTIALHEYWQTVETLWDAVKEFMEANPRLVSPDNAMGFLSDDDGLHYNYCHFWSNFEIGDLELWRGEAYSKFFDFLDQKGGFYYERWGDAPVHSIGAALFAKKDQIHFFSDFGYRHDPNQHCPQGDVHKQGKCWCDPAENIGMVVPASLREIVPVMVPLRSHDFFPRTAGD